MTTPQARADLDAVAQSLNSAYPAQSPGAPVGTSVPSNVRGPSADHPDDAEDTASHTSYTVDSLVRRDEGWAAAMRQYCLVPLVGGFCLAFGMSAGYACFDWVSTSRMNLFRWRR
eukprot:TRINITY_DN10474_c0_g1_i2.p2 TRINITY_DN10474_c0_g1~~TRINITY_DN10474_c0_g1_i2.p2  ORF type:complete len:115 (-),score=9.16 TRINITY_DN10474_c0_g1_i2:237-581(-)